MKWFSNLYGQVPRPRKQSARRRASFRPQLETFEETSAWNHSEGLRILRKQDRESFLRTVMIVGQNFGKAERAHGQHRAAIG